VTQPLIEHWDGTNWSLASIPSVDSPSALNAVSASSDSNVWAVGFAGTNALTEHWDGLAWSDIPTPSVVGTGNLFDVQALASNDAWAVGVLLNPDKTSNQPLILHWDG
jgi:hypothetical protein